MNIKLYKVSDAVNVADKTLDEETAISITATPFEPCDVLSPDMIIDYNSTVLTGYNYAYISDFGRYYFVSAPVVLTGQRMRLHCDADVLTTWASALRSCPATVTRSESQGAPGDVPDNKLPVNPNTQELKTIPFRAKTGNSFHGSIVNPFKLVWSGVGADTMYLLQIRGVDTINEGE